MIQLERANNFFVPSLKRESLLSPNSLKRTKRERDASRTLSHFYNEELFFNTALTRTQRWEQLKKHFTPIIKEECEYLCLKLRVPCGFIREGQEQFFVDFTIQRDKYDSHCFKEKDLNKEKEGQEYDYVSACFGDKHEDFYFQFRKNLTGTQGEILQISRGPHLSGKESLDICMRLINFLAFNQVILNDDSKIPAPLGEKEVVYLRISMAIISSHTFYTKAGFVLWETHPTHSIIGKKILRQKLSIYNSALSLVRTTALSDLEKGKIIKSSESAVLKNFSKKYSLEYTLCTVQAMAARIHAFFTSAEEPAKTNASLDFSHFYRICLWSSGQPDSLGYNNALDTLYGYRYWIKELK